MMGQNKLGQFSKKNFKKSEKSGEEYEKKTIEHKTSFQFQRRPEDEKPKACQYCKIHLSYYSTVHGFEYYDVSAQQQENKSKYSY